MQAFGNTKNFKLAVPEFRQKYGYTCEAAALRIVLNYLGIQIDEDQILQKMPVDRTPRKTGIWGDPDLGFVGNLYGNTAEESYGIHWRPMASFASKWRPAKAFEKGKISELVDHLLNKRPVMAWVINGKGKSISWKTPTGKKISAIEGEHVVVLYGYRGDAKNPEGFFIMDPIKGPQFKTTNEFKYTWSKLGNAYLVIYGDQKI